MQLALSSQVLVRSLYLSARQGRQLRVEEVLAQVVQVLVKVVQLSV